MSGANLGLTQPQELRTGQRAVIRVILGSLGRLVRLAGGQAAGGHSSRKIGHHGNQICVVLCVVLCVDPIYGIYESGYCDWFERGQ